ncbi:unnamed protein product [Discosporangium mesarthrocarpum]
MSTCVGPAYGVLAFSALMAGTIACYIDPIDPNVRRFHQGKAPAGSAQDKTFCFLCQLHVNKGSRHCRYCDKCVDRFDHHCKWLNNCVGRSNYRCFVALLVATFLMISLQLGFSVWLLILYHTDDHDFRIRVLKFYGSLGRAGHIAFVYVFTVFVVPFMGLLAQLLGFHIMLMWENLTTYDYIMREQKKERERKQLKAAAATRRKEAGEGQQSAVCCGVEGALGGKARQPKAEQNGRRDSSPVKDPGKEQARMSTT